MVNASGSEWGNQGWYGKRMKRSTFPPDIKWWKNGDILTLIVDFGDGTCQIRRNDGENWDLPSLQFEKGTKHAFAFHADFEYH